MLQCAPALLGLLSTANENKKNIKRILLHQKRILLLHKFYFSTRFNTTLINEFPQRIIIKEVRMFKQSIKIDNLLTNGKSLILALDQGLEHGPKDFTLDTIDPYYVLDIAHKGKYNAIILQKGLAEKYYENYTPNVPLIIKVNGKTNIAHVDPYAAQTCSVKHAVELGAAAIGYTIYLGSPVEALMIKEFAKIQEETHRYGLPVIAWMYPRGPFVPNDTSTDILSYAARTALELGADFLKIKYNFDYEGLKWLVQCAGQCKVLLSGGEKTDPERLLLQVQHARDAGATGLAIGRNVWQHPRPLELTNAIKSVLFENKSVAFAHNLVR